MAVYYVRKTGSDANSGLSAALAKLTIQAAVTAATTAGDTIVVGGGAYYEQVTFATSGTSGNPITLLGDVTGELTGDEGMPTISAWDADLDFAANSTRAAVFVVSGRSYLVFGGLHLRGGGSTTSNASYGVFFAGTATDRIIVRRCVIQAQMGSNLSCAIFKATAASLWLNLLIENNYICTNSSGSQGGLFQTHAVANAPTTTGNQIIIRHNYIDARGSSAVTNFVGGGTATLNYTTITNNVIVAEFQVSYVMFVQTTGAIFSNNLVAACFQTATLVEARVTTATTKAANVYTKFPFINPIHAGLFSVYGTSSPVDIGGTTTDYFSADDAIPSRMTTNAIIARVRPARTGYDSGPVEIQPVPLQESTTVDSGTYSVKISGAGEYAFELPVDAVATTVTVRVRKNSSYSGTAPKFRLEGATITATEVSHTAAADVWETLSLTFTPSAKDVLHARVFSYSTAASTAIFIDNMTIA